MKLNTTNANTERGNILLHIYLTLKKSPFTFES